MPITNPASRRASPLPPLSWTSRGRSFERFEPNRDFLALGNGGNDRHGPGRLCTGRSAAVAAPQAANQDDDDDQDDRSQPDLPFPLGHSLGVWPGIGACQALPLFAVFLQPPLTA